MSIFVRFKRLAAATAMTLVAGALVASPARAATDDAIHVRDGVCDYASEGLGAGTATAPFQISTAKELAEIKDCTGETISVTGASSINSGTQVKYTLSTSSNYLAVGQVVSITGVTPASLNVDAGRIVASDSTSITIASTVADAYTSGGQVNGIFHYFELAANVSLASGNTTWNDTAHALITGASGDGTTVTYTTSAAHGLTVGENVVIKGVLNVAYSIGQVTVASVPDATHFTVTNGANPGSASSGGEVNGLGWTPIDDFTGFFDGRGHTLSGMTIHRSANYLGLFGQTHGSSIRNLVMSAAVVDATTTSAWREAIALLVGYADTTNLSNIDVSGDITGGNRTGLVLGGSNYPNLVDIHAVGTIRVHNQNTGTPVDLVGGVAGDLCEGGLYDASANITINALNVDERATPVSKGGGRVGGIAGEWCGGLADTLTASGSITGANYRVGGIFGRGGDGDLHNASSSVNITYNGEDFSRASRIGGLWGDFWSDGGVYDSTSTGNVTISIPSTSTLSVVDRIGGFFGYWGCCATASRVTSTGNVVISSLSTSTGANGIAGFAGYADCCGGFSEASANGLVQVTLAARQASAVGGFAGYSDWGMAYYKSEATGDVDVNLGYDVGGFIGEACCSTNLRNVRATGDVTVGTNTGTNANAGALIGYAGTSNGAALIIDRTYATGNVTATGNTPSQAADAVGGLVGFIRGTTTGNAIITNSYYRGALSGTSKVGGLIGWSSTANTVLEHSYVSAGITATATHAVKDAVANGGISDPRSTSAYESGLGAASQTGVNARSGAQMKSQATYTALGFGFGGEPWQIDGATNGGYPTINLASTGSGTGSGTGTGVLTVRQKWLGSYTFSNTRSVLSVTQQRKLRTAARLARKGHYQHILVRSYTGSGSGRYASYRASIVTSYLNRLLKGTGVRVSQQIYTNALTHKGEVLVVGFKYTAG